LVLRTKDEKKANASDGKATTSSASFPHELPPNTGNEPAALPRLGSEALQGVCAPGTQAPCGVAIWENLAQEGLRLPAVWRAPAFPMRHRGNSVR